MTVYEMGWWDKTKIFIRLFLYQGESPNPRDSFITKLSEKEIRDITVSEGGGLEVSVENIKGSTAFAELEELASRTVIKEKE